MRELPPVKPRKLIKAIARSEAMFGVTFSPEADILMSRWAYSVPELLVKLSNLIKSAQRVQKQSQTIYGKFINRMTTAHRTGVVLDGRALEQLLDLTKQEAPISIKRHRRYLLELEEAEELLANAKEAA